MINLGTDTVYRRIGQNYFTELKEHAKHPDSFVTGLIKPSAENQAGKFSQYRDKAKELAQKLNIGYEQAVEKIHSQGGHVIDIMV
ncbi:hypothetical protein IJ732_06165 [bacterium]|nr:hypothetical protein [bacterium]